MRPGRFNSGRLEETVTHKILLILISAATALTSMQVVATVPTVVHTIVLIVRKAKAVVMGAISPLLVRPALARREIEVSVGDMAVIGKTPRLR